MTKREAAIVSAYTGFLIGEFSDMALYAEEKFGKPMGVVSLAMWSRQLKDKSESDFIALEIT